MPEPQVSPAASTTRIFRFKGQRSRWRHPHPRLEPEASVKVSNINMSEFGTADRRAGYDKFSETIIAGGENVTGLWEQQFITPNAKHQLIVTPTKIYTDNGTTRKDITGSLTLNAGIDGRTTFTFLLDQVIATNGKNPPWLWAGDYAAGTAAAEITLGGTFTSCHDFAVYENLLVALRTTESGNVFPTRIRWSDIDSDLRPDITAWPSDNKYELDEGTEAIVAGAGNFGRLLVFKRDGLYPGFFNIQNALIEFQQEEPKLGFRPVAKHSLVARPEFVWIVAEDGAYIVTPDLQVQKVTDDIQDVWESLNQDRIQHAVSTYNAKTRQVITLISSTSNETGHDMVIRWDWESGDITIDELGDVMSYISRRKNSDNKEVVWYGSLVSGYVYDSGTTGLDDAASIDWELITATNDLGKPNVTKVIKNVTVWYKALDGYQAVTLEVVRDQGVRSTRTKTLTFGSALQYDGGSYYDTGLNWPGGSNEKARFFVNRNAENISLRLTGSDDVNLHGYSVEFMETEPIAQA